MPAPVTDVADSLFWLKLRQETSESWAARFRRNLLSHCALSRAPFLLIARPEHLYFWRQTNGEPDDLPPQFVIHASTELKPYFDRLAEAPEKAQGEVLELILFSWLVDLAESGRSRAQHDPSLKWLFESGLRDALATARLEANPVQ